MAKSFVRSAGMDRLIGTLARAGIGMSTIHLLTTRGRHSRQPRTTPVNVVSDGQSSWVVALDAGSRWVRNARADGQAVVRRGRRSTPVRLVEVNGAEARHAVKTYLTHAGFNRAYFEGAPDAPEEELTVDTGQHPAFRIESVEQRLQPER